MTDSEKVLADTINEIKYEPKHFAIFNGCYGVKDISKHLAASNVMALVSLIAGKRDNLSDDFRQNLISEEIAYDAMGYPKCWGDRPKNIFLKPFY